MTLLCNPQLQEHLDHEFGAQYDDIRERYASEIRDFDWFNKHLYKKENVNIKNVTKDYGVLVLAGPNSRKVLSQLTSQNLNNNDFPWLKGKEILINKISVRALRVNYVGELGWELHHSMNQMEALYDVIYEVGKKENIVEIVCHDSNNRY